jgi:asparagine synthase (glutamine-hydrolysing)
VAEDALYLMTPAEVVLGYLFGTTGSSPPPTRAIDNPRAILEDVIREALLRPPCGVAFSGGRDSSVVLAVATHVARRDGLPEPVPITRVFPDTPETDERTWQEEVVRYLGLRDWQRVIIHDELDVVGPIAAVHLREYGVVWPPTIATDVPVVEVVPGGSVIDGEGGDEVLCTSAHRVAPLTRLVRQPRPLRWRRVRSALGVFAPAGLRAAKARGRHREVPTPWLRPAARDAFLEALAQRERSQRLSFAASVQIVPRWRAQVIGMRNRRILAGRRGVDYSSPLLHPDFVRAIARDGGVLGRGDRTQVLRALAPDLLPDHVLARTDKAAFNGAHMSLHTREFAAKWSGDGVDSDLVDPEELRHGWMNGTTMGLTKALLQQAWLASQRRASESAITSSDLHAE